MSFNCKYQIIIQGCSCCKAQDGCPPVYCPNNVNECLVYNNKKQYVSIYSKRFK